MDYSEICHQIDLFLKEYTLAKGVKVLAHEVTIRIEVNMPEPSLTNSNANTVVKKTRSSFDLLLYCYILEVLHPSSAAQ